MFRLYLKYERACSSVRRQLPPKTLLRVAASSDSVIIDSKLYTRIKSMPDAIWVDRQDQLEELAQTLAQTPTQTAAQTPAQSHESGRWIGVDTEFLRERTFFPKLCLLQLAAAGTIWCVDTLRVGSLDALKIGRASWRERE